MLQNHIVIAHRVCDKDRLLHPSYREVTERGSYGLGSPAEKEVMMVAWYRGFPVSWRIEAGRSCSLIAADEAALVHRMKAS